MIQTIKDYCSEQFSFPFNIDLMNICPEKPLDVQIEETYKYLYIKYANDQEILENLQSLHDDLRFLLKIAPEFDYDPKLQANGFWSMIKLILKFSLALTSPDLENKIGRQALLNLFKIAQNGLKVSKQIYDAKMNLSEDESKSNKMEHMKLYTSKLDFLMLWELVESLEPEMITFHEFFNYCWLGSMSKVMQLFINFLAIYSAHWKTFKMKNILSRNSRARMFTDMFYNVNIDCLKSMWNITDFPLVRIFTPSFWFRFTIVTENIYIPRQKRWFIDSTKPIVHDLNDKNVKISYPKMLKDNIRCLLFKSKENTDETSKSLILHVHGGGFISQSPESHSVYLTNWVKKLKNIPILSIDYTLSPEGCFPVALQEMLDCYLWLLSKDPEVKEKLGFFPEKICFCGDSAGGNFSVSMMVILSHIQRKMKERGEDLESCRYPNGLFIFYAPLVISFLVSPSRILTSVDALVPLGTLLNCLAAYVPPEICYDVPKICPKDKTDTILYQFGGQYLYQLIEMLKYFLSLQSSLFTRTKPWFRTENLPQCLERMNKFLTNPFMSPLLLEEIEFNHVPLYLYPLTYDSFLDDSIELAKKWQKDKVKVQVIPDVPHGFLNLIDFNHEAKQASYLCLDDMRDILN